MANAPGRHVTVGHCCFEAGSNELWLEVSSIPEYNVVVEKEIATRPLFCVICSCLHAKFLTVVTQPALLEATCVVLALQRATTSPLCVKKEAYIDIKLQVRWRRAIVILPYFEYIILYLRSLFCLNVKNIISLYLCKTCEYSVPN